MPESLDTAPRAPRFDVALDVSLPGVEAVTRNVSATGAYLRISSPIKVGSDLTFALALPVADGLPMRIRCSGRVVRVDDQDGALGVAVEFSSYVFEPPETPRG